MYLEYQKAYMTSLGRKDAKNGHHRILFFKCVLFGSKISKYI